MFLGEYIHTIDQKRRLAIPAKFRKILGKRAIVAPGLDKCLVIYSIEEWQKLATKLENLPSGQKNARGFNRIILAGATDVNFDKLGRVLIPENLKNYALLKKNIAILGLSNKIELWEERKWKEYKKKMEKTVDEMAQELEI